MRFAAVMRIPRAWWSSQGLRGSQAMAGVRVTYWIYCSVFFSNLFSFFHFFNIKSFFVVSKASQWPRVRAAVGRRLLGQHGAKQGGTRRGRAGTGIYIDPMTAGTNALVQRKQSICWRPWFKTRSECLARCMF